MTDHSLAAEGPADHIRNALQLLIGLNTRVAPYTDDDRMARDVARTADATRARLQKALAQLEEKP